MVNSRDVGLLRPDVRDNCLRWLQKCDEAGLEVLVTNTVRDSAYQEYLYQQGRSRPGKIVTNGRRPTFHSVEAGLAFDFCRNGRGNVYDDPAFFQAAADIAKAMGFSWGGDWASFPDAPHIQWDLGGKWTGSMILAGSLPPEMPLYQEKEEEEMRYQTIDEAPQWARDTLRRLTAAGFLNGDGQGLDLRPDMVRLLVICDRAGVFGR